ncbi:hypothetical protein D9758_004195 [Tetrapyrgos nigripes]|uniref:F-box domain-containing protein n=1 Tax=Tetrapyrgos nigripes TaxID=182062 RepID=A0A8H5GU61_9AGAR|nr:hypothetical protein D9758_004195 [Tetrapyrgos nigripes]
MLESDLRTQSTLLCPKCHASLVTGKIPPSSSAKILLRSKHALSETEIVQTKCLIDNAQLDLERFDEEIASLSGILEDLKKKRAILSEYKDEHSSLFAPVRKLPIEIFNEIFTIVCLSEGARSLSITTADDNQSKVFPQSLFLAQTCSLWRSILLQNHRLWSHLRVDLSCGESSHDYRPLLQSYIDRSKPASLTVELVAFRFWHSGLAHRRELESRQSWNLFQLLLDTNHRWANASFDLSKRIYLRMEHELDWKRAGIVTDKAFAGLKSLELKWNYGLDIGLVVEHCMFFETFRHAKSLQSLFMTCHDASFQTLPELTTFGVETGNPFGIARLFDRFQGLKFFTIKRLPWLHLGPIQELIGQLQLHHSTIETLWIGLSPRLREVNEFGAPHVLGLFDLPSLKTLSIHGTELKRLFIEDDQRKWMLECLKLTLSRSPSLHTLTLEGHLLPDHALVNVLSTVPSLRRLTLITHSDYAKVVSSKFFRALRLPSSEPGGFDFFSPTCPANVLPHLTYLEIRLEEQAVYTKTTSRLTFFEPKLPDREIILSMLESRRGVLEQFELYALVRSIRAREWVAGLQPGGSYWQRLLDLKSVGLECNVDVVKGTSPVHVVGLMIQGDERDSETTSESSFLITFENTTYMYVAIAVSLFSSVPPSTRTRQVIKKLKELLKRVEQNDSQSAHSATNGRNPTFLSAKDFAILRSGTTFSITDPEAEETRDLVYKAQHGIDVLDEKLSSLTKTVAILQRQRSILAQFRSEHLACISSRRNLPVEILIQIFSLCCLSQDSHSLSITTEDFASKITPQTLHLAQTCSHWREIVLDSPSLWSDLRVDVGWRKQDVYPLVQMYLRRSKPALLTLTVEAVRSDQNTPSWMPTGYLLQLGKPSWRLLKLLLKTRRRWVQASLDLSMDLFEGINDEINLEGYHELTMKNLKSLELRWDLSKTSPSDDSWCPFFSAFEMAPSLQSLRTSLYSIHSGPFSQQLTTIEVETVVPEGLEDMLVQHPALKTLKIQRLPWYCLSCNADAFQDVEALKHDSLETLLIGLSSTRPGKRQHGGPHILDLFNFPSLTHLSIHGAEDVQLLIHGHRGREVMVACLKTMLSRSPDLHSLVLDGDLVCECRLVELLQAIPRVRHLTLIDPLYDHYESMITDNLFRALQLSPNNASGRQLNSFSSSSLVPISSI